MKLSGIVLAAAAMAIAAFIIKDSLAQTAATAPSTGATRVGAVDVMEVIENYKKAKDLIKGLNDRKAASDVEDQKRKESIDRLEAEIANLNPGMPEYEKRFSDMQHQTIERESWRQFDKLMLEGEYLRLTKMLYEEVREAAGRVGKEQGFQMVIAVEHKQPEVNSVTTMNRIIETRKVLYCDESIDLTEAVLKRLNETRSPASAPAVR